MYPAFISLLLGLLLTTFGLLSIPANAWVHAALGLGFWGTVGSSWLLIMRIRARDNNRYMVIRRLRDFCRWKPTLRGDLGIYRADRDLMGS